MTKLPQGAMASPALSPSYPSPTIAKIFATSSTDLPYDIETEKAYLSRIKSGDTFAFIKRPPSPTDAPRVIQRAMQTAYNRVFKTIPFVNAVTGVSNIVSGTITGTIHIMTASGSLTRTFKNGDKGWKCDVTITHQDGSTQTFPMYSLQRCMNPVRVEVSSQKEKITNVDDSGITFTADKSGKVETALQTVPFLRHAERAVVLSYQNLQNLQMVASHGTFVKIADDRDALLIERNGIQRIASNITGWQPILSDTQELFSSEVNNYEKRSTTYRNMRLDLLNNGQTLSVNRIDSWDMEDQFTIELT